MDGYYAWMIVATALVLMMTTPALALFYGGMTRSKSVLNMMMMSYVAMARRRHRLRALGLVGGLGRRRRRQRERQPDREPVHLFGLKGVVARSTTSSCCFQLTFAVITAALISGAIADRVKLSSWIVFLPLWVTLVLLPDRAHGLGRRLVLHALRRTSTTPAARSCTSTPVSPAGCWHWSSAGGSASCATR